MGALPHAIRRRRVQDHRRCILSGPALCRVQHCHCDRAHRPYPRPYPGARGTVSRLFRGRQPAVARCPSQRGCADPHWPRPRLPHGAGRKHRRSRRVRGACVPQRPRGGHRHRQGGRDVGSAARRRPVGGGRPGLRDHCRGRCHRWRVGGARGRVLCGGRQPHAPPRRRRRGGRRGHGAWQHVGGVRVCRRPVRGRHGGRPRHGRAVRRLLSRPRCVSGASRVHGVCISCGRCHLGHDRA
mmetsp:Transcript_69843/g.164322  ORF Transcript_69843/g.164322 Transcript_69843/m.164322 type:complete len:240 (-) Transcript_69843:1062-1781(-)